MVPGYEGERYGGEVNEGEDKVAELEAGERVASLDGLGTAFSLICGPTRIVVVRLFGGAGHEIQDVEEVREDENDDRGDKPETVAPRGVLDGVAVHRDGILAFLKEGWHFYDLLHCTSIRFMTLSLSPSVVRKLDLGDLHIVVQLIHRPAMTKKIISKSGILT